MRGVDEIRGMFLEEARGVWGDVIDKITFAVELRSAGTPMSLAYKVAPRQAGGVLFSFPPHMTLRIHTRLRDMPEDQFRALLRHEAIHIGVPGHGWDFKNLARIHNAPLSESQIDGTKPSVWTKPLGASRYAMVREFDDLASAQAFAHTLVAELRGSKTKIQLRR